jgi:hypothetical protein
VTASQQQVVADSIAGQALDHSPRAKRHSAYALASRGVDDALE